MKKLSWLLVLAMLLSMCAFSASAEGEYTQAPMFDAFGAPIDPDEAAKSETNSGASSTAIG